MTGTGTAGPPASVTIRTATPADGPAIDAFATVAVPHTYTPLAGADYAAALLATRWGSALDPEIADGGVTIAVEAGRVVGLAQVGELDGTPVLRNLCVDPSRRRAGIGRSLVASILVGLPAGSRRLLVEHIAADVDAARFYRRNGFQRTHFEPNTDRRHATIWRARPVGSADGSGGGHSHDQFDWSEVGEHLVSWDRALAAVHADMATWLGATSGMRIADIGSGAGGFAAALAEQVAPTGEVTLVDTAPELLALARNRQPASVTVTTVHADLEAGPLSPNLAGQFDLVHAGAVVHHTDDQLRTLRALIALLAPGGRLAVGEGGLSPRFLPSECGIGEPGLESRLEAATTDWFWTEVRPVGAAVPTYQGWGRLLAAAGLRAIESRTFLLDRPPPLPSDLRALVAQSFGTAAARAGERLAPDDHAAITALVDPNRDDSVHHRPDVFILAARTMHVGRLAN